MYCRCGCSIVTPVAYRNRYDLGHIKGQHIPFLKGHALRGRKRTFTEEWKSNISKGCQGRTPWNKGRAWTEAERVNLRGPRDTILGAKNPNWKGGIDCEIRGLRRSREYLSLKKMVRDRDRCCVQCGSAHRLQVDHIKSFTYYPELRYDPKNVRLLCWECHRKTPNFGAKAYQERM